MADQVMNALRDIDPMIDDAKILVRVVRIWKAHPITRPNEIWSLEVLFQDEQVIKINLFLYFVFSLYEQVICIFFSLYEILFVCMELCSLC